MSYCTPVWTSDYTYRGVLDYRLAYGYALAGLGTPAPAKLLVASGFLDGDAATLDPLFVIDGTPAEVTPGPYALVGFAADGAELLRVAFDATEVSLEHAHAFHVSVPIAADVAASLHEVRVERDGRVLAVRSASLRSQAAVAPDAVLQPDGSVTVTWDVRAYEAALVRDGEGGPLVGSDRTGRLTVRPTGRVLELLLSDGVLTLRRTLRF